MTNLIEDIYPASYLQRGMLIESKLNEKHGTYHDVFSYTFNEKFNRNRFITIWEKLVEKHELLRATFIQSGLNGYEIQIQKKLDNLNFLLFEGQNLDFLISQEKLNNFNFANPGLFRLIINQKLNGFDFLFSFHHCIADGWSIANLINEFIQSYIHNAPIITIKNRLHYGKFVLKELAAVENKVNKMFWQDYIQGVELPYIKWKAATNASAGDVYQHSLFLTHHESKLIDEFAKFNKVTVDSVFLYAYICTLSLFFDTDDITVGFTVNNRLEEEGGDTQFGLFLNVIPFRLNLCTISTPVEGVRKVFSEKIKLYKYKHFPLFSIQSLSKGKIFDFSFNFMNFHVMSESINSVVDFKQFERTSIPFVLNIFAKNDGTFSLIIIAHDDFSDSIYLENFNSYLYENIKNIIYGSQLKISLNSHDYYQIIHTWNATDKIYSKNKTIDGLFEDQVARTPDHIAVIYEDQTYTYRELSEVSNQLARFLLAQYPEKRVPPGALITIFMDRSVEMLISILGILKAGAAYVPIDPSHPEGRISHILEETNSYLLLTHSKYVKQFKGMCLKQKLIRIDEKLYKDLPNSGLTHSHNSGNLAYVMYTSGTTGLPKGVCITHTSVVNRIEWMQDAYSLSHTDVILQKTPYSFDVSVWELFWANWYGARLIIAKPDGHKQVDYLYELIHKHKVTIVHFVPSMLSAFIQARPENARLMLFSLRHVFCSGEELLLNQVHAFYTLCSHNVELHNLYGPTEATVDVTAFTCPRDVDVVSIGKAIHNTRLYVLNAQMQPVPAGVKGELYIGGIGLAQGYLNQPELTRTSFIPNPFATEADLAKGYTRLYKTGDMVQWLPDGNVEYLGRNDFQVKIRGQRVELTEIENILSLYPLVEQCAVCIYNKTSSSENHIALLAYYSSKISLDPDKLYDYLYDYLPQYMIPSVFVKLDAFPLTSNGKLDRQALLQIVPKFTQKDYIAPRNDLEQELCRIWRETLEVDRVGINDNFYHLGGNSIISIRLVAKMQKLKLSVTVADLVKHKTIMSLVNGLSHNQESILYTYGPYTLIDTHLKEIILETEQESVEDIYPASYLQMGMLITSQLNKDEGIYHDVFVYTINANFSENSLLDVFQALSDKHPLLRTSFRPNETFGYLSVQCRKIDIHTKYHGIHFVDISTFLMQEKSNPFDTQVSGLFRIFIINPTENKFYLAFSFHHAIADGWSVASLLAEFRDAFISGEKNSGVVIPPYPKFIKKELEAINNESFKNFWKHYLDGYTKSYNNLILEDINHAKIQNIANDLLMKNIFLSDHVSLNLISYAKILKLQPDVIFLSVYLLALSRFVNQEDLVIGLVVHNRIQEQGGEHVFGLHLNTVPLRIKIECDDYNQIEEFVLRVAKEKDHLEEYKIYPYGKLKSDINEQELYDCSFNYVHFYLMEEDGKSSSVQFHSLFERNSIPLTFSVSRYQDKFCLTLRSSSQFSDKVTIERFLNYINYYLNCLFNNTKEEISILPEEYKKIMNNWNATDYRYMSNKTIHEFFEEQVSTCPNHIALVYRDQQLTYRELNEAANQLARFIQQRTSLAEMRQDTLIALCVDTSIEMVIGILGILKAGGAYVPIDHNYPAERIRFVLQDTNSCLLLTKKVFFQFLQPVITDNICCIFLDDKPYQNESTKDLQIHNNLEALAYVIYTSGTTGMPKGVMITHGNVSQYNNWINSHSGYNNASLVDCSSSLSFDATVTVLLTPLCSGQTVVLCPRDIKQNPQLYIDYLERNNIDLIKLTPSYLSNLLNEYEQNVLNQKLRMLRCLIIGGEKASKQDIERWMEILPHCLVIHHYGPTEVTVGCISYTIRNCEDIKSLNTLPLGRISTNNKAYVLDKNKKFLPIGVVGELYISGQGLASGYLNQPELTSERFTYNPFTHNQAEEYNYSKLYKTGDLVRWLPDGNLEYIGRIDSQIKVRGYRIELTEIEQCLLRHPCVQQAVVKLYNMKTDGKSKQLILAYYISKENADDVEVRLHLAKYLPEYMLPNAFIVIEAFPLTINGKLDYHALPLPQYLIDKEGSYVAPKSPMERKISVIWQKTLGVEKISVLDDFFNLGGDSIQMIQIVAQLQQEGVNCSIKDIFDYRCIRKLSMVLEQTQAEVIGEQDILVGEFNLSPIQLWFFKENINNKNHYNQSFLIRVPELSKEHLQNIILKLVEYHDALRITFIKKQSGAIKQKYNVVSNQTIHPIVFLDLDPSKPDDLQQKILRERLTSWQSDFDIENGPLWRIGYISGYQDGKARIFFAAHHLIIDEVSWRILVEDIKRLYYGDALEQKGTSYRQWLLSTNDYTKQFLEERNYWNIILKNSKKNKNDFKKTLYRKEIVLSEKITNSLLSSANDAYNTRLYDLLLVALAYTLCIPFDKNEIVVMLESHDRALYNNLDISRTLGWFTSKYPARLVILDYISETIEAIKESLQAVPNYGIGYSIFKSQSLLDPNEEPAILFNYLGRFDNNSDDWQIVPEYSGENLRNDSIIPHLLAMHGAIIKNKLQFRISTNISLEFLETILEKYIYYINKIVEHCLSLSSDYGVRFTPLDYYDFSPHQIINSKIEEPSIFFMPPILSDSEVYKKAFIRYLSDKKLVFFNNFYLYLVKKFGKKSGEKLTYKYLASVYVKWIEDIQPKGPYILCGWSSGGILGLEIARQISAREENGLHIILLDSRFNFKGVIDTLQNNNKLINYKLDRKINYTYCPLKIDIPTTRISLFKANMPLEEGDSIYDDQDADKNFKEIDKHYIQTTDNYLSTICTSNIEIIEMQANHISWLNDAALIEKICNKLHEK